MGAPLFWALITIGVVVYQIAFANTYLGQNVISGFYLVLILFGLRQYPTSRALWDRGKGKQETRTFARSLSCILCIFSILPWFIAIWMYGEEGFFRFLGLSLFSFFLFTRDCKINLNVRHKPGEATFSEPNARP